MILAPGWSVTRRVIASPLIVVPPALVYALAVLPQLPTIFPAVANPTAAGVAALLGTPLGAAVGWAHFIAFDLFVGRWCYCDNYSRHPTPDNYSRHPPRTTTPATPPRTPGSAACTRWSWHRCWS